MSPVLQEDQPKEWYVGEYRRQEVEEALMKENKVRPRRAHQLRVSCPQVRGHSRQWTAKEWFLPHLAFLSAGSYHKLSKLRQTDSLTVLEVEFLHGSPVLKLRCRAVFLLEVPSGVHFLTFSRFQGLPASLDLCPPPHV